MLDYLNGFFANLKPLVSVSLAPSTALIAESRTSESAALKATEADDTVQGCCPTDTEISTVPAIKYKSYGFIMETTSTQI